MRNGAQLTAATRGQENAGSINITARNTVSFDGFPSAALSTVESTGVGNGGGININTGSLNLTNGAVLAAGTRGQGDAGSINITARDTVFFDGLDRNGFPSGAASTVELGAIGKGGDILISTDSLALSNGAQLSVATRGQGNAGTVTINARDTVFFDGEGTVGFSTVEPGAIGKGGDISISTGSLAFTNGAQLAASTFGQGDAGTVTITARDTVSFNNKAGAFSTVESEDAMGNGGDILINTGSLALSNAQLLASTSGQGDAGTVSINARDTVSFDDEAGALSTVQSSGVGKGGDININTRLLSLTNGAQLDVSSFGRGTAGNIEINSSSIRLENQAGVAATTASGNGGNITLRARDLLLLRRGSQISTTAGTAQAGGDGGNITINAPFIIANNNENSDISANAFSGRGGRVNITANGVYGIQFRPQLTLQSDITASSELGVAGVVEINTPDVDPSRGLIALPAVVVNSPGLAASNCNAFIGKKGSEFTITGRGGLPLSPDDFLSSDVVWSDTRLSAMTTRRQDLNTTTGKFVAPEPVAIVPATGWIFNKKGEVTLISNAANTVTQDFGAATCAGNLSSSN